MYKAIVLESMCLSIFAATNECEPDPCQNGATCTDLHVDYNCSCPIGYSDKNCSTSKDNYS